MSVFSESLGVLGVSLAVSGVLKVLDVLHAGPVFTVGGTVCGCSQAAVYVQA